MATLPEILARKWKGREWTITGDDYSTLQWTGDDKPSEAEIRAFSDEVDTRILRERMVVTPRQFRLALHAAGLLATANSIASQASEDVQIAWEYAVSFERVSPLIDTFAGVIGLTAEEVDAVFEAAAQIGD